MSKRSWILLGAGVPALAFFALLAWASVNSGGNPGGLGVNSEFGQVQIDAEVAREFSLELLDGSVITLSGLQGNVVMLDFWASWCKPCREEAPVLAQIYREFQGEAVEFVGVDLWDTLEGAISHIDEFRVPYPNGVDSSGTIAIDYGVAGIPEKIFIDKHGVIARKFDGPIIGPINVDKLRATLRELLDAR